MNLKRDPSYLLGQLAGIVLMSGITAAVAATARRAWKRNAETPELPDEAVAILPEEEPIAAPQWRTLRGEIVELREGEVLVDDGKTAIRFTTADVPVLNARTGQPVDTLPERGSVAVVYDACAPMTMSLPPLSNGAVSILLDPIPADMLPLRSNAEAMGYQVSWLGFQTPIVLTKDDIRLELLLDSDRFTYTHMTRDLQPLDHIERLSQPVRLDGSVVLAPAELIAALV